MTRPPEPPQHLTADEVAGILRTTPYNVLVLIRKQKLRATKPGKSWLIPLDAVYDYLDSGSNQKAAS